MHEIRASGRKNGNYKKINKCIINKNISEKPLNQT